MFQVGDKVYAVSFRGPKKWIPVTVVKPTGPVSYLVKDPNGNVFYRHVDHLRIRYSSDAIQTQDIMADEDDDWSLPSQLGQQVQVPISRSTTDTHQTLHRSVRTRRPVDRFAPTLSF